MFHARSPAAPRPPLWPTARRSLARRRSGNFRGVGWLLGVEGAVRKDARLLPYVLIEYIYRRTNSGNMRELFGGTYFEMHGERWAMMKITKNRFFSFGTGAIYLFRVDEVRPRLARV